MLEPAASYVFAVAWSPSKPLVLAVGCGGGAVCLYDLARDRKAPAQRLMMPNGARLCPSNAMRSRFLRPPPLSLPPLSRADAYHALTALGRGV